jgi:hypothetical protein
VNRVTCDEESVRCFLVEWYQPDLGGKSLDDIVDGVRRRAADGVRLLAALTVPTDETLFGVFAADSIEAVVRVCQRAGWHTDRITGEVRVCFVATGLGGGVNRSAGPHGR